MKHPLHILQIGMTPSLGGVESYIVNLYRALDKTRIQFDFIDMYGGIAYEKELSQLGARIFQIPFFKRHPLGNFLALYRLMKTYRFDYVHVNMLSAAYFLPFLAAKMTGTPIIAHSHNSGTDSGILRKILHYCGRPLVSHLASYKFACSSLAEQWLFNSRGKAIFIPNAIDVQRFSFSSETRKMMRKTLALEDKWVLGHVGRFTEQKNHTFLIDIFAQLAHLREDAILILVGTGPLEMQIKKLVHNKGLDKKVIFLGARTDLPLLYQAFDAFLLPSLYEGLPVCAVEAQIAGLPCFLSAVITQEVDFTHCHFLPINTNVSDWVQAILEQTGPRKQMLATQNPFDISVLSKKIESFYTTGNIHYLLKTA